MKERWEKVDENGKVIEKGVYEKIYDSVTLKKDSKGNIQYEIKAYGVDIGEALKKASDAKKMLEAELRMREITDNRDI